MVSDSGIERLPQEVVDRIIYYVIGGPLAHVDESLDSHYTPRACTKRLIHSSGCPCSPSRVFTISPCSADLDEDIEYISEADSASFAVMRACPKLRSTCIRFIGRGNFPIQMRLPFPTRDEDLIVVYEAIDRLTTELGQVGQASPIDVLFLESDDYSSRADVALPVWIGLKYIFTRFAHYLQLDPDCWLDEIWHEACNGGARRRTGDEPLPLTFPPIDVIVAEEALLDHAEESGGMVFDTYMHCPRSRSVDLTVDGDLRSLLESAWERVGGLFSGFHEPGRWQRREALDRWMVRHR